MEFENKNILVTGATQGIGLAIVKKFAENGANVILVARNQKLLESICFSLREKYTSQTFISIVCDLSVPENIPGIFSELRNFDITTLDVLVNNAGVMIDSMLAQQKVEDVTLMFNTNVVSCILMSQLALRLFLRKREGKIINIASIIGERGSVGQTVYAATKAALIGFTKSLSKELARLNINVNSVSPGFIDTDMTKKYSDEAKESIFKNIGFRRAGTVDEVANAVLFLASDKAIYITGHDLKVNGGMII